MLPGEVMTDEPSDQHRCGAKRKTRATGPKTSFPSLLKD
jgi:hypothetical protein